MRLIFNRKGKQPPPEQPEITKLPLTCHWCSCAPVNVLVWSDGTTEALCFHHLDFVVEMLIAIDNVTV